MPPDAPRPPGARRAAVVANPTKHDDITRLRDTVRAAMSEHGWDEPVWLETTAEDPGTGQAAQAVRDGVDLVLACGGDGTVTACANGVAGSGVPLGILPRSPGPTGGWTPARPTGTRSWSWPVLALTPR